MQRLFASLVLAIAGVIGLLALASPLEAGGGGGHGCPEKPREGTDEPVMIKNSCFTPAVLYVAPGATVTWTNEDELPHNVTFLHSKLQRLKDLGRSASVSHTFSDPGLYAYYCSLHPSMLDVVAVGDPAGFVISPPQAPAGAETAGDSATASSRSGSTLVIGGLVLVGLVSAGGGYLLRRRPA
jgi:plastocyanin